MPFEGEVVCLPTEGANIVGWTASIRHACERTADQWPLTRRDEGCGSLSREFLTALTPPIARRLTCFNCFLPARSTQAPSITGFQTRKALIPASASKDRCRAICRHYESGAPARLKRYRRSKLREPWETMANLALRIIFLTASEGGDVRSYSRGGSDRPPKIGLRLGGQLPSK